MNPFRSPMRRLFLIVAPAAGALLSAVIMYLPAVQEVIAGNTPPVVHEQTR